MSDHKPQICIIHGGDTFSSDEEYLANLASKDLVYERLLYAPSWRNWLAEQLPGYDVILPSMPNKQNAKYNEWSIYFSKIVPFLNQSTVLVGHSLGGIFLAKYFTEHPPIEKYRKLVLLAAPYADEVNESLGDFTIPDAKALSHVANEVHLMHSTDDPLVPIAELERYASDLPSATVHRFADKHHFIDETFPELLELITSN